MITIIIGVIVVTGLYALLASMVVAAACSDAKIQKIMAERDKVFKRQKE